MTGALHTRRKVVLYNPRAPFYTMPLGLLAVGSALAQRRFEIKIVDGRLEHDPVAAVVREIDDAICFGVTMLTGAPIADAITVLRAVKARRPDLVTVCGGWHPSLFPTETLEESSIDVTVQGQGEATFAALVSRLAEGGGLENVQGIAFRGASEVVANPGRPLLPMEDFAPVDYGLIPVERYFELKQRRQLDYISSIGCPFRCAFCADPFVYRRGWKALGPERVGEEVAQAWSRYRFDDLNFQDETFFTYQRRVEEIAQQFLDRDLEITWAATMRADQGVRLGEDVFRHCVRSGLRRVLIGVESGSPSILKSLMKDTKLEQVVQSAEMCARNGVAAIFSFIVGFPGETEDDVRQTMSLVKLLSSMSPKFQTPIFYFKPYPGSALARGITHEVPKTIEEWAKFDYVQGEPGPWVAPGTYRLMERFKFYNRHAWRKGRALDAPLRALSRWRCRNDRYELPFEKAVVQRLWPEQVLS